MRCLLCASLTARPRRGGVKPFPERDQMPQLPREGGESRARRALVVYISTSTDEYRATASFCGRLCHRCLSHCQRRTRGASTHLRLCRQRRAASRGGPRVAA